MSGRAHRPHRATEVVFPDGTIRLAFDAARAGQRVEVGCIAGHGRTGTVLACIAVLAGIPAGDAVAWVRDHYCAKAIEPPYQDQWVRWFARHASGVRG